MRMVKMPVRRVNLQKIQNLKKIRTEMGEACDLG